MFHILEGLSESESKDPASPGYQCFKVKAEIHQFIGHLHISPFLLSFLVLFLKFSIQILKGRVCFLFLTKLSIIPHFIVFSSICSWKLLTSGKETSISLFLLEELCILISILIFILSPHPYPHSYPWFLILNSSSSSSSLSSISHRPSSPLNALCSTSDSAPGSALLNPPSHILQEWIYNTQYIIYNI